MKCAALSCEIGASVRGYCRKHYLRRYRRGLYGRVDGAPTRAHIAKLYVLGWSYSLIDQAAGVRVAAYVASGRTRNVLRETEEKILAIPLTQHSSAVGFRRRIEALGYMGWSRSDIAAATGLSVRLVNLSPRKATIRSDVFAKLKDFYDRSGSTEGPSRLAALRARTAGYAPPIAWELTNIDDPKARPFQGFKEAM